MTNSIYLPIWTGEWIEIGRIQSPDEAWLEALNDEFKDYKYEDAYDDFIWDVDNKLEAEREARQKEDELAEFTANVERDVRSFVIQEALIEYFKQYQEDDNLTINFIYEWDEVRLYDAYDDVYYKFMPQRMRILYEDDHIRLQYAYGDKFRVINDYGDGVGDYIRLQDIEKELIKISRAVFEQMLEDYKHDEFEIENEDIIEMLKERELI